MAISLARHGADVVVSYLKDEENAGKTVKEIKKNAIKSRAIQADLRKWGDAQNLINETIKHFKKNRYIGQQPPVILLKSPCHN